MTPEEFLTKMLAGLGIDPERYRTEPEEPDADAPPMAEQEEIVAAWLMGDAPGGDEGGGADE